MSFGNRNIELAIKRYLIEELFFLNYFWEQKIPIPVASELKKVC